MSDTASADPRFVPVDLNEMMDQGVLMAANEAFFWPLGLALTWTVDKETGEARDLHIRQWEYEDGHRETIEIDDEDEVALQRRRSFKIWRAERMLLLPEDERS